MESEGAIHSSSSKAKISTISSTESEVAGVGERLPKHLWLRGFRIEQGGYSKEDALCQGSEAAILLENNGRYSCKKGSRYIHIRYFFITDRIKSQEIKVMYCPAEPVAAGYLAKPLQGALFFKFRDAIMGIDQNDLEIYQRNFDEVIKKYEELKREAEAAAAAGMA